MKAISRTTSESHSKQTTRTFLFAVSAISIVLCLASLFSSCRSPDPVESQRKRNLTADERYLVDYYIQIIEFEKEQFETFEQREARRKELETEFDMERLRKVLSELAKDPRRWLAIYYRVNEIQAAGRTTSERY